MSSQKGSKMCKSPKSSTLQPKDKLAEYEALSTNCTVIGSNNLHLVKKPQLMASMSPAYSNPSPSCPQSPYSSPASLKSPSPQLKPPTPQPQSFPMMHIIPNQLLARPLQPPAAQQQNILKLKPHLNILPKPSASPQPSPKPSVRIRTSSGTTGYQNIISPQIVIPTNQQATIMPAAPPLVLNQMPMLTAPGVQFILRPQTTKIPTQVQAATATPQGLILQPSGQPLLQLQTPRSQPMVRVLANGVLAPPTTTYVTSLATPQQAQQQMQQIPGIIQAQAAVKKKPKKKVKQKLDLANIMKMSGIGNDDDVNFESDTSQSESEHAQSQPQTPQPQPQPQLSVVQPQPSVVQQQNHIVQTADGTKKIGNIQISAVAQPTAGTPLVQVLNQNFSGGIIPNSTAQQATAQANIPFHPFLAPNFTINNGLMVQRSGGFKLTLGEDGRLILQHDPTLNQDLNSQLILQSLFGLNGGLVLQPPIDQQVHSQTVQTIQQQSVQTIQQQTVQSQTIQTVQQQTVQPQTMHQSLQTIQQTLQPQIQTVQPQTVQQTVQQTIQQQTVQSQPLAALHQHAQPMQIVQPQPVQNLNQSLQSQTVHSLQSQVQPTVQSIQSQIQSFLSQAQNLQALQPSQAQTIQGQPLQALQTQQTIQSLQANQSLQAQQIPIIHSQAPQVLPLQSQSITTFTSQPQIQPMLQVQPTIQTVQSHGIHTSQAIQTSQGLQTTQGNHSCQTTAHNVHHGNTPCIQTSQGMQTSQGIQTNHNHSIHTTSQHHSVPTQPILKVQPFQKSQPPVQTVHPQPIQTIHHHPSQNQQSNDNNSPNTSYVVNLTPDQLEQLKRNGQVTVNGQTIFMQRTNSTNKASDLNSESKSVKLSPKCKPPIKKIVKSPNVTVKVQESPKVNNVDKTINNVIKDSSNKTNIIGSIQTSKNIITQQNHAQQVQMTAVQPVVQQKQITSQPAAIVQPSVQTSTTNTIPIPKINIQQDNSHLHSKVAVQPVSQTNQASQTNQSTNTESNGGSNQDVEKLLGQLLEENLSGQTATTAPVPNHVVPPQQRVHTIQLTPQKQQQLKHIQQQIQAISARMTPNDTEMHNTLKLLFSEQQKILASGKLLSPDKVYYNNINNQLTIVSSPPISVPSPQVKQEPTLHTPPSLTPKTTSVETTHTVTPTITTTRITATVPPSDHSVTHSTSNVFQVAASTQSSVSTQASQAARISLPTTSGAVPAQTMIQVTAPSTNPSRVIPNYTRAQLIEQQMNTDQNGALKPDVQTPFRDKADACKRLIRYHCFDQPVLSQKDLNKADEIFEVTASVILDKISKMHDKYKCLLEKESTRDVRTSEKMMIDRMIVAEEQQSLMELRDEQAQSLLPANNVQQQQSAVSSGNQTYQQQSSQAGQFVQPNNQMSKNLGHQYGFATPQNKQHAVGHSNQQVSVSVSKSSGQNCISSVTQQVSNSSSQSQNTQHNSYLQTSAQIQNMHAQNNKNNGQNQTQTQNIQSHGTTNVQNMQMQHNGLQTFQSVRQPSQPTVQQKIQQSSHTSQQMHHVINRHNTVSSSPHSIQEKPSGIVDHSQILSSNILENRSPSFHDKSPNIVDRSPRVHDNSSSLQDGANDRSHNVHERLFERSPNIQERSPSLHERNFTDRSPSMHERTSLNVVDRSPNFTDKSPNPADRQNLHNVFDQTLSNLKTDRNCLLSQNQNIQSPNEIHSNQHVFEHNQSLHDKSQNYDQNQLSHKHVLPSFGRNVSNHNLHLQHSANVKAGGKVLPACQQQQVAGNMLSQHQNSSQNLQVLQQSPQNVRSPGVQMSPKPQLQSGHLSMQNMQAQGIQNLNQINPSLQQANTRQSPKSQGLQQQIRGLQQVQGQAVNQGMSRQMLGQGQVLQKSQQRMPGTSQTLNNQVLQGSTIQNNQGIQSNVMQANLIQSNQVMQANSSLSSSQLMHNSQQRIQGGQGQDSVEGLITESGNAEEYDEWACIQRELSCITGGEDKSHSMGLLEHSSGKPDTTVFESKHGPLGQLPNMGGVLHGGQKAPPPPNVTIKQVHTMQGVYERTSQSSNVQQSHCLNFNSERTAQKRPLSGDVRLDTLKKFRVDSKHPKKSDVPVNSSSANTLDIQGDKGAGFGNRGPAQPNVYMQGVHNVMHNVQTHLPLSQGSNVQHFSQHIVHTQHITHTVHRTQHSIQHNTQHTVQNSHGDSYTGLLPSSEDGNAENSIDEQVQSAIDSILNLQQSTSLDLDDAVSSILS